MPHLLRNGREVKVDFSRAILKAGTIVFLNHRAAMTPVASGVAVAPARFVSLPSIAYRLARAAAGDGVAAVSLSASGCISYAAGHALLRGAGGVLLSEDGQDVTYSADGESRADRCFGGAPKAAHDLAMRSWSAPPQERLPRATVVLSWPRAVSNGVLDRAKGCLFGQVIGDNLGGLVEFETEQAIAHCYPDGVRDLCDGGRWDILVDLTRFGGHLISWEKGVHDADDTSTLFIWFPGADGRAGSIGPLAGGAGSGVRAFRSVDP